MSELDDFRTRISALDRAILAALNERLTIVADLKRYKAENGVAFVDPERERRLLDDLAAENPGPLSEEGLRRFYVELLALVKRELEE